MNKITVKIDGMMCGMCESHINDAIRCAFPVKKVTSSHAKGVLTETDISEEQLCAVMEPTGYRVLEVSTEEYEKKAYPNANYEIVEGYGHLTYSVRNRDEYVKKLKSVERGRLG